MGLFYLIEYLLRTNKLCNIIDFLLISIIIMYVEKKQNFRTFELYQYTDEQRKHNITL